MTSIPGTVIGSKVVPSDTADTYPTHEPQYGKGGIRTVADNTARNAIPNDRCEEGMIVFVQATEYYWRLKSGFSNPTVDGDWERVYVDAPADVLEGNTVIESNLPVVEATLQAPTTNAYFWNIDATTFQNTGTTYNGTKFGGIDVTCQGGIGTATDVIGNTSACSFGSGEYLYTTDTDLNTNGSFSISVWAYDNGNKMPLVSNYDGTDGWTLTSEGYTAYNSSSKVEEIIASTRSISGWHHYCLVRDTTFGVSLYIDGNHVGGCAYDTIGTGSQFEIRASNSTVTTTGLVSQVVFDKQAWAYSTVLNLFKRTTPKMIVEDKSSETYAIQNKPREFETVLVQKSISDSDTVAIPIGFLPQEVFIEYNGYTQHSDSNQEGFTHCGISYIYNISSGATGTIDIGYSYRYDNVGTMTDSYYNDTNVLYPVILSGALVGAAQGSCNATLTFYKSSLDDGVAILSWNLTNLASADAVIKIRAIEKVYQE